MSRTEEYQALLAELERTPPALEYTVQRAQARAKKHRRLYTVLGVPAASMAGCLAAFILLVNFFPTFAFACGRVPVLRELAKVVAWSPSLSAAVENNYVQPIDQEKTSNNITARIEYVIVDQKQLNIFFTLRSDVYDHLEAEMPEFPEEQPQAGITGSAFHPENGDLLQYTLDFSDKNVPNHLTFSFVVHQWSIPDDDTFIPYTTDEAAALDVPYFPKENMLAAFTFTLNFDPYYTSREKTIAVGNTFPIYGLTLTLTDAEIYPTHLRLNFADSENNTAWLKGFDFYLENEKGERFESVSSGISSTGSQNSPMTTSFYMDSSFFSDSKSLALHITRVYWLEHDRRQFRVDLNSGTADWLPDGVELLKTTKLGDDWVLTFLAKEYQKNHMYSLVNEAADADGSLFSLDSSSSSTSNSEFGLRPGYFYEYIPLKNYTDECISLEPIFSKVTEFSTPIVLQIQ